MQEITPQWAKDHEKLDEKRFQEAADERDNILKELRTNNANSQRIHADMQSMLNEMSPLLQALKTANSLRSFVMWLKPLLILLGIGGIIAGIINMFKP